MFSKKSTFLINNYANIIFAQYNFYERILDMHNLNLRVYTRCSLNIGNAPVVKWAETMPLSTIIPTLINSSGHAPLPLWCIVGPSPSTRPEIFCIYIYIYVGSRPIHFHVRNSRFKTGRQELLLQDWMYAWYMHGIYKFIVTFFFIYSTIQFPLYIMDCRE